MAKKLNIQVILKHLDLRNLELYQALWSDAEERKELERVLGYILPLWFSGVYDGEDQIEMMFRFNRQVNIDWRELEGHPELRAKILAAIGLGKVVKHDFHHRGTQARVSALKTILERLYPDINKDEISLWCSRNSEAALVELCSACGVQEKDSEEIIECYRKLVA